MKYYKNIKLSGYGEGIILNNIYQEDETPKGCGNIIKTYVDHFTSDWEKSTKVAYNKQEGIVPKPRVKKVVEVDTHIFKVGDKVKFIDCVGKDDEGGLWYSWGRKVCTKGNKYKVTSVSPTNGNITVEESHLTLNKLQFELSTQTKLKQTEMENYSIEGSKALKTAFVEECKLKVSSITKLDNTRILISEGMPIGTIQSMGNGKASQHFILPKDWDAAVKYVTEFNTPKVVFKNGDYVVVLSTETYDYGKSCGNTRPIIGEIYLIDQVNYPNELVRLLCTSGNKIAIKAEELRIATSTEIKGIPPIYKMAGYSSIVNKSAKTISFGCQTYTKAEVKLLLDAAKLCERVGYSAKVKASGFVVNETDILTPDSLTKILAQLK